MTIWVMMLEPIETRYTGQWVEGIKQAIHQRAHELKLTPPLVVNIWGPSVGNDTTPGAFLNFANTNIWKGNQLATFSDLVAKKQIRPGDHVLFTDAWNPAILNVRYMCDLLKLNITIHAMWHAGSYDPWDFLGRLITDTTWSLAAEASFAAAAHINYFGTEYHKQLFLDRVDARPEKCVVSGQPHAALIDAIQPSNDKTRTVVFPHRMSAEKQPELFKTLAEQDSSIEWTICQSKRLSKTEYHEILSRSRVVFSANLQETLGIGVMEGVLAGAIPLVPDRLSYSEMYLDQFKYPQEWSKTPGDTTYVAQLLNRIRECLDLHHTDPVGLQEAMAEQRQRLVDHYLTANPMIDRLLNHL